jgi:hypothetical protein
MNIRVCRAATRVSQKKFVSYAYGSAFCAVPSRLERRTPLIATQPHPNRLLDELDLVVVELATPESMVFDGGTAEAEIKPTLSVTISISGTVSISYPPSISISLSASVSASVSWDAAYEMDAAY